MAALYFHIPFCLKKCSYCDFVSFAGREAHIGAYRAALEAELAEAAGRYGRLPIETVYFGGGTPSLPEADLIVHLMAMCRALFSVNPEAEITVECNPGTLSLSKLRDYRACGVNRLSLGMQAAQEKLLRVLGRVHTPEQVRDGVELARQAGFTDISLDLMYALPGQGMADWVDSLKEALALAPTHLSLYSLILEPGTPLADRIERGELQVPEEEVVLSMQHAACRILGRRGYRRYEISNYALPGHSCRHNLCYWTRGDYLGLGLAAHSFMGGERFANTNDFDAYLSGTRRVSGGFVGPREALEEEIMLGTRLSEGIALERLKGREDRVRALAEAGLATVEAGRFALTQRGMDVQNAVVLKLLDP